MQVVLLVFDLDSNQSFNNLQKWETTMKQNGLDTKNAVVMLVGNKSDIKTQVIMCIKQNSLKQNATQYAKKKGY